MKDYSPSALPAGIDASWRIGIVASLWHADIVDRLMAGAQAVLTDAGIPADNIPMHRAPGSFEIPLIGAALAESGSVDALIGCGVIVEGETHHARLLADASAHGIMDIQIRYRIPFAFEVLYVDAVEQAAARATDADNKGAEAARAVLWSLDALRKIQERKRM